MDTSDDLLSSDSSSDKSQKILVPAGGSHGNGWTVSMGLAVQKVTPLSRHHV